MGGESNIAEGWRRYLAGEMGRFLAYASSSLEEATRRVQDGIDREYFLEEDAQNALQLGVQAGRTTAALRTSLEPFMKRRRRAQAPRSGDGPKPGARTREKDQGLRTKDRRTKDRRTKDPRTEDRRTKDRRTKD
jgi:hypothetical protein